MKKYIFNDQVDEFLTRFYETYSLTRDTEDFVSPGTHKFVYKFLDRMFKKTAVSVYKDVKKRIKQYKKLAKKIGLTIYQYLELIHEEENLQNQSEEVDAKSPTTVPCENIPIEPETPATNEQPTDLQETPSDKPENEPRTDEGAAAEEPSIKPKRGRKKAQEPSKSSDQGVGTALSALNR